MVWSLKNLAKAKLSGQWKVNKKIMLLALKYWIFLTACYIWRQFFCWINEKNRLALIWEDNWMQLIHVTVIYQVSYRINSRGSLPSITFDHLFFLCVLIFQKRWFPCATIIHSMEMVYYVSFEFLIINVTRFFRIEGPCQRISLSLVFFLFTKRFPQFLWFLIVSKRMRVFADPSIQILNLALISCFIFRWLKDWITEFTVYQNKSISDRQLYGETNIKFSLLKKNRF